MRPGPDGSSATRKPSRSTQSAAMRSRSMVDGPAALFGMSGEGPVVGVDPGLLVAPGLEGPGGQGPGGRHDGGVEREGESHLEQVALGTEAVSGRPGRRRPARPPWPTGGPAAPEGASAQGVLDQGGRDLPGLLGRIDHQVEGDGAVAGREQEGGAGRAPVVPGQDGPGARATCPRSRPAVRARVGVARPWPR